jgi:hypothetical protein
MMFLVFLGSVGFLPGDDGVGERAKGIEASGSKQMSLVFSSHQDFSVT